MKWKLIFFLLIYSCLSQNVFSQKTINPRVAKIDFEGLQRTRPSFLLPFLKTQKNETLNKEFLAHDVQKLKNIPSLGNASYRIDTLDNQIHVVFKVEEVRTLLPILNFGGVKGNTWLQLGFTDINWWGKGQFLTVYYRNTDRRHSGEIFYRNPFYRGTYWGFSGNVSKWASREPLFFPEGTVNYDYDVWSTGGTIIRHLNLRENLEFGATYFVEKYSKSESQILANPPGPNGLTTPKILFKSKFAADHLDYHYHFVDGYSGRVLLQNIYNFKDKNWFHTLQFQSRFFRRFNKKGNLALRLRLAISTNIDTPFAPFVVDSHVNLRGAGNRIDRGTAQMIFNAEYRHTIRYNKKWAWQGVVFSDLGSWRNPGGELSELIDPELFRQFVGGGIRVIYQKVFGAVLRIDYGIDVFNTSQHGLVIGLGQYL